MTLCWETAYKWASLSKRIAAWCLNGNSTVAGVIITVTFCIIGVCAPWIWGRMMAALMNQWANEAAIVLVYWNTLREIEDFSRHLFRWMSSAVISVTLPRKKGHFSKHSKRHLGLPRAQRKEVLQKKSKRGKKEKEKRSRCCRTLFFSCETISQTKEPCLDWGRFEGQISWRGNFVGGRHAERLIIPELASFLFIKKC